jgi:hypothetical protein
MARDPGKCVLACCCAALGIGLVAWPWMLPSPQPNPLPAEFRCDSPAGRQLSWVLRWYDHACSEGDVAAFLAHVTKAYAASFAHRLRQLGRPFDGAALQAYVGPDQGSGLAASVDQGGCYGRAAGDRACLVVGAAQHQHGSSGFAFAWDGAEFRLDRVEHQPSVDPDDAGAVAAFADRLLRQN